MAEPFALLDRLQESGFTASICTTYNAYLPFYEQVVLRRLRAAGCQLNIVLMDSAQLGRCLAADELRPRLAGDDYVLIPVSVGRLFHPKVLLRLGKRKGSLFVGSHNLTFAGMGHNHEISTAFAHDGEARRGSVAHFQTIREELRRYVAPSLPGAVEALDAALAMAPWLTGPAPLDPNLRVLASHADAASVWTRARALVRGRVRRVLIVGPFFDDDLAFVAQVRADLTPELGVWVGIDPSSVAISVEAAARSEAYFVDVRDHVPSERREKGRGYLHAKLIWIETDLGELLVAGSANPSRSAFLHPIEARNAEIVVARWSDGTRDALLREARIDSFLDAPPVLESGWVEIATRLAEEPEEATPAEAGPSVAETTEDGFVVIGALDDDVEIHDPADAVVGVARFVSFNAPHSRFTAPKELRDAAASLLTKQGRRILVHHVGRIGELFASDTRRALRTALGRLDEDPAQLEALLRLTEKVIFDAADITMATLSGSGGGSHAQETNAPTSPASLALDAQGRRSPTARRPSIASGDLAVLLDALIRRLGTGLPVASSTGNVERDDEELAESDENAPPADVPREIDLRSLAALCRGKVKTLVRRMLGQLEAATAAPDMPDLSRRAVVQLAAVLSLLRVLRAYERRPEWRRIDERLLDAKALSNLFQASNAALVMPVQGLLGRAIAANDGEVFEEHHVAVGLLFWLAWETEVDVGALRRRGGSVAEWEQLQRLLFLAPWCGAHAMGVGVDAVRAVPRRGVDLEAWLDAHVEWIGSGADADTVVTGAAGVRSVGTLVLVPERFQPRLRVVLSVDVGTRGDVIVVLRPDGDRLKLLASRAVAVEPADVARAPLARGSA